MRRIIVIAGALFGLVLAVIVLRSLAERLYFAEKRQLQNQIRTERSRLSDYADARLDHRKVKTQLQSYVDRTLGGDQETVDSRLRSRLSRLGERVGLTCPTGTRSVKLRESPAKIAFGRSGMQRALREEEDFYELEGWISGTGTLEQVLKLIEMIDAEPWLKRIDQLTIDPNENGTKFQFNIELTTLFLPKQTPNPDAMLASSAASASNGERYALLVRTNPFRLPPPAPNPPPVKASSAPEAFPFGQWLLTGIAQSAAGPEIWLLNQHSQETKYLNIGERLNDITFVAARGETAEFLVGADRFSVAVGKNLNDRTPLKQ